MAPFERPSLKRSLFQLANTLIPYLLLWAAMAYSMRYSYWITLALALPAAGFLIRSFIIFHDCGHGAFFRSRRANRITEFWTGLINFMPSYCWSHSHARHHASAGDLDRRGVGDIWTLTVDEYRALPPRKRLAYRLYRQPVFLLLFGPAFIFLIEYRYWKRGDNARQRRHIIITNLALLGIVLLAAFTIGIKTYLAVQGTLLMISGATGVWLFYVQHQFEDTYWERHGEWDYLRQALGGSSFYKLPRLLQWFSGNIGYHHIHHLSPRIPNYFLQKCHEASPLFQAVKPLTLKSSLRCLRYRLWDEKRRRLVGFSEI